MVMYRRNRVAGGTYFFTLTLRDRRSAILVEHIDLLRAALLAVMRERPFQIEAMVVLPEHIHALWTLPPGDDDYPGRIRRFKGLFTRAVIAAGVALRRNGRDGYDLWQRRYWEHTVRDAQDFARHADYMHWNPVKHGHVTRVADWPHSSFHRFVAEGLYSPDWAGDLADTVDFGE